MTATLLILGGMLMMLSPWVEEAPLYQSSLKLCAAMLNVAIPISTDVPKEMEELLEKL